MSSSDHGEQVNGLEPSDDEQLDEAAMPHFTVSFFSNDEHVPSTPEPKHLSSLVNQNIEANDDEWETKTFDFIIGNNFLRKSLFDFADMMQISTESVIKIECIVREPAPTPGQDLPHADWVGCVHVTDKIIVSSCYDGHLYCWTHDGKQLLKEKICEEPIKSIAVDKQHRVYMASQNSVVYVYKLDVKGKIGAMRVAASPAIHLRGHERSAECVAVSKDGTKLISGGFDNHLKVWNVDEKDDLTKYTSSKGGKDSAKKLKTEDVETRVPLVTLTSHKDAIVAATWDPLNDKHVFSASWDHEVLVWDLEMGGVIGREPAQKAFTAVSANPFNGRLLTGSTDPVVRLWDTRDREGSRVKQSFSGHGGWVSGVSWSPTNENLFISSSFDKASHMWDVRSAKTPLYTLAGHTDRLLCVDWSNLDSIATGSVDCTLKTYCR
ncbi:hypothetical protein QR680_007767 [Steinernema hermaphroditum]|uniref:NLE domain-containing protein n=1 Tax=Steinernema hermaphroditum TaxID=289476 RepID=A0AA39IGD5_9BILA|nr:hypothetical protein QR680_007767 [Steinernema hermaphroditum]